MRDFVITGKYTTALCHLTDNCETGIEPYAIAQLQRLCDNETLSGSRVRIMPDVHPGKVGTIGFTMTIGEKLMPSLVGVDIGCGMTMVKFQEKKLEFQKLDKVIRERVPSGASIHAVVPDWASDDAEEMFTSRLCCNEHIDLRRARRSLGTLGSGNHFIEIDRDENEPGSFFLTVHSGSRFLGKAVTEYYLAEGQKALKQAGVTLPYEETYLEGELLFGYLSDLKTVQDFADENRRIIVSEILKGMKWKAVEWNVCRHNHIDFDAETINALGVPVLRKGAIRAKAGEPVIIPVNMRDGIILGTGKGNAEWNFSAPHGAGRILKREDVKAKYTTSQYKKSMEGIYSPSVGAATLDEAPFAYRAIDEIRDAIGETVTITKIIRPVYNFKAGGED